jgi:hypothetical protein
MTSPNGCSSTSPGFSREATPPQAAPEVAKGQALGAGARRPVPGSTFAAHLELHAKDRRAPATTAAPGVLGVGSQDVPSGTEAKASDPRANLRAMGARDDNDVGDRARSTSDDLAVGRDAAIDPMVQVLVALAPPLSGPHATARPEPALPPEARPPIEQLMAKLVRRIAWSGNARSGLARLELGAGELAGATLTIQADNGVLKVALDLPPGVDRAAWKERISGRLGARGLHVDAVDVA